MRKRFLLIILLVLALTLPLDALAATATGTSDPEALGPEGGNATLTVTVTNDSASPMENIAIGHNGSSLFSDTSGAVIEPGTAETFSSTVTIPSSLVGSPIPFDLTWTEGGEAKRTSFEILILNTGAAGGELGEATVLLSATRKVSTSQASQGEVITLTYTLTNNGVTPIESVSIVDSEIAGSTPLVKDVTLVPGEPYVFTYDYTMGRSTVTSSPVISFLQADGSTGTLTIEDKALGMVKSRISVEVEQGLPSENGQTFTLVLTNNGNQRISDIKVTDELDNPVSNESFSLAIGESTSFTYTVPTDAMRNVVFRITGVDATDTDYSDHTETYVVRKYVDPSLVGISFGAAVAEPLDSTGAVSIDFTVTNDGDFTMTDLQLSEAEYGTLYVLESVPKGTETINQKVNVGSPRDLTFTLTVKDPAGNEYSYTAYVSADYVGAEQAAPVDPAVEVAREGDLVSEVGGSVTNALRTVLIVLVILTVLAGFALIILRSLEKEERKRMARRKAQRERMLRQQALEQGFSETPFSATPSGAAQAGATPSGAAPVGAAKDGGTRRIPNGQGHGGKPNRDMSGDTRIR